MNAVEQDLTTRVEQALEQIRPYLKSDGGDITLVEITDDHVVRVKLLGACHGCSVNQMTLKAGVEQAVKKHAPEIRAVENIEA